MFDAGPIPQERWPEPPPLNAAKPRSQLRERLLALGAFSGVAIGAVAGFEMVIGGGFDFITPAPEVREVAPSSYVTVHRDPWSSDVQVIPLSSTEPLFAGPVIERPADQLAGGYDDPSAPEIAFPEVSEEEIRAQIDALYRGDQGPEYVEASIIYEDAPAIDEPQAPRADPYAEAEAMVEEALGGYTYEAEPEQDSGSSSAS